MRAQRAQRIRHRLWRFLGGRSVLLQAQGGAEAAHTGVQQAVVVQLAQQAHVRHAPLVAAQPPASSRPTRTCVCQHQTSAVILSMQNSASSGPNGAGMLITAQQDCIRK